MERNTTPLKKSQGHLPSGQSLQRSLWILMGLTVAGGLSVSRPAFADPHAIFFTDRAQEQLFFNVLAALNQADYVEPPNTPPLQSDQRLGQFIQTGQYTPDLTQRTVTIVDGLPQVNPPPEPAEQLSVELPRIRVRQVTSDDGDVFYRERLERRALAEEMRVLIAQLACRGAETVFGPTEARAQEFCLPRSDVIPIAPP